MGKNVLQEALDDVQALRKAAQENAKSVLLEQMSPQIKSFIETHLGEDAPAGGDAGAPGGNSDSAHASHEGGEDAGAEDAGSDDDAYEIDDDEADLDLEDEDEDADSDEEDEDGEEDEDEDSDDDDLEESADEKPAKKGKPAVEEAKDDDDDEDDDKMDEEVEVTSEDLKRAFHEALKAGLKEDPSQGKFGDQQDPNDGEYGLVHKVPGEVMWADGAKVIKKAKHAKSITKEHYVAAVREVKRLQRENAQYVEAIKLFKKNLHEMNLFNAKLVYTTKLLQNNSLSNKQKLSVVETIDAARSKREVEFMFNTLSESFKIAGVLGESRGTKVKGPKASRIMKPGSTLNENKTQESTVSNRWAELAGLTE